MSINIGHIDQIMLILCVLYLFRTVLFSPLLREFLGQYVYLYLGQDVHDDGISNLSVQVDTILLCHH